MLHLTTHNNYNKIIYDKRMFVFINHFFTNSIFRWYNISFDIHCFFRLLSINVII